MANQLITYHIPINTKITKGRIYNFYRNNNSNLELSSILNTQTITLNNMVQSNEGVKLETNQVTISKEDYTRLLELNHLANQLNVKQTKDIQKFIQEETKTTAELTKINTERQELIKRITKDKELLQ